MGVRVEQRRRGPTVRLTLSSQAHASISREAWQEGTHPGIHSHRTLVLTVDDITKLKMPPWRTWNYL